MKPTESRGSIFRQAVGFSASLSCVGIITAHSAMCAVSRSQAMYAKAEKIIPSGVNSPVRHYAPHPFFTSKARGGNLWDEDGRKYIDLCNGYGAVLLGHSHPAVTKAVSGQLRRGQIYGTPSKAETELAGLIGKAFPSMQKIRLVNTGGEATMAAIRLARGYTGKNKIIKFEGGYHGAHDSMLVRAGSAHAGISVSAGVPGSVARQTLVAKYNDLDGIEELLESCEDIAGIIVEPVLANAGLVPPAKGFLRGLRRVTRKADALLIFDEVVTGFRVAPGGAQELYGVRPDLTTLGKALGNGFAIAAVGGSSRVMDMLAPGGNVYQASTFAGNPMSVSAAIATLKQMRRQSIHSRLERACASLADNVSDCAKSLGIEHSINRVASMFQIFFTREPITDYASATRSDRAAFYRLFRGLLKEGVFVPPSQFETAFLSAAHSMQELERVASAYRAALGAVRR